MSDRPDPNEILRAMSEPLTDPSLPAPDRVTLSLSPDQARVLAALVAWAADDVREGTDDSIWPVVRDLAGGDAAPDLEATLAALHYTLNVHIDPVI